MLEIDEPFKTLFYSLSINDTLRFRNETGRLRMFIITEVDSVIHNSKGGFINSEPYKLLQIKFSQQQVGVHFPDTTNEVFVNKYPRTGITSLHIDIGNYWYSVDDSLPAPAKEGFTDTSDPVYKLVTDVPDMLKYADDIKDLYVSVRKGFIAFETLAGEKWLLQND